MKWYRCSFSYIHEKNSIEYSCHFNVQPKFICRVLCCQMEHLACTPNKYGQGCLQTCQCQNGASCNAVDGSCTCTAGVRGVNCETSKSQFTPPNGINTRAETVTLFGLSVNLYLIG